MPQYCLFCIKISKNIKYRNTYHPFVIIYILVIAILIQFEPGQNSYRTEKDLMT